MPSKPARKKSSSSLKKSWKDVQSKARMKKRTKLAILVLSLVAGFLILSWAIKFTQNLFNPWKSVSYQKNYLWNGEFNINLVLRSKDISILSYNPKEGKITILHIPDNTFLEVPFGFGKWQLRSVYGLGESQNEIGGDKLLVDTLVSFLGLPIDGFLDFNSGNSTSPSEIIDILRKNPFSGINFLSNLKTNLTTWELLKLKLGVLSVRFDKVMELDLNKMNILDTENLSDGTEVFTSDPVKLDSVLTGLTDPAVTAEHKSIAVLNATDQPQLAGKWARLITNLGGNVIITSNAQNKLKQTLVVGEESKTLKRLQQIFAIGCKDGPKCGKVNPAGQDLVSSRAQINLILGEDFAGK